MIKSRCSSMTSIPSRRPFRSMLQLQRAVPCAAMPRPQSDDSFSVKLMQPAGRFVKSS